MVDISGIKGDLLAALTEEAAARSVSVEALVVAFAEEGLARSRARAGASEASEAREVEGQYSHGTSLGRFTRD